MNLSPFLSATLVDYVASHSEPVDPLLEQLVAETRTVADDLAILQISPDVGELLTLLCRVSGAREAIEIGTFTGYSSLCIARGLPTDGCLVTCDIKPDWAAVGRRYWEAAGVADRIQFRAGFALKTLRALPATTRFDFAFLDADKPSYLDYFEELLPRMRPGALIVVDNVLWAGRVLDLARADVWTTAIREFNDAVAKDDRVDCLMLTVGDGVTLLRVR